MTIISVLSERQPGDGEASLVDEDDYEDDDDEDDEAIDGLDDDCVGGTDDGGYCSRRNKVRI